MPTFAHLAGFEVPSDRVIDGVNQTDLLTGKSEAGARDNYYYQGNGIRVGKWKYLIANQKVYGYAKDNQRAIEEELYDLDADMGETRNLAKEHPEIVARLKERMQKVKGGATDNSVQSLR